MEARKVEEWSDFNISDVYSLSDLTPGSSDAGVSGYGNGKVKIKSETKDFADSVDQLTDHISPQSNIKQEPQPQNDACSPDSSYKALEGLLTLSKIIII